MTAIISKVSLTNTFDYWRRRTNDLVSYFQYNVITVANNGSGLADTGSTFAVGDGGIVGKFSANTLISSNNISIGNTTPTVPFQIQDAGFNISSVSSNSTSAITSDSFAATAFRTTKFLTQVKNTDTSNAFRSSEILITHDGTTVYKTEYAVVNSGTDIGSFDCSISSGNVNLTFTQTGTANINIKVLRTSLPV